MIGRQIESLLIMLAKTDGRPSGARRLAVDSHICTPLLMAIVVLLDMGDLSTEIVGQKSGIEMEARSLMRLTKIYSPT